MTREEQDSLRLLYNLKCFVFVSSRYKEHAVGGPSSAESSYHRTCEWFTLTAPLLQRVSATAVLPHGNNKFFF